MGIESDHALWYFDSLLFWQWPSSFVCPVESAVALLGHLDADPRVNQRDLRVNWGETKGGPMKNLHGRP